MKKFPKISIVLNAYNAERTLEKCLQLLFSQDYPKNKIELLIAEGGSRDKTTEIIKKFMRKYPKNITLIHNPKKYKLGRGMGADTASRKATGEMILMIDPDNLLVQKNWLKKIVNILLERKDITAVQSGLIIPKKASTIDKYLGAAGIEDPFAIPYSLNAQVVFNPRKFRYDMEKKFFIYEVNKDNFYYAGDNGFLIWKKAFFSTGGYTQDIDNFYRMALSQKKYKIAIPKDIRLYHKSPTTIMQFLKRKGLYLKIYLQKNFQNRDFYWFSLKKNSFRQNFKFIKIVLLNLLIIPGLIQAINMAIKQKQAFWLIHPLMLFLITLEYIYSAFYVKISNTDFSLG